MMTSIIVSSRQFRDRQRELLDIADGKQKRVFIRRGRRMFLVTPVEMEDIDLNPEMIEKVKRAEEDFKNGNDTIIDPKNVWSSLKSLKNT